MRKYDAYFKKSFWILCGDWEDGAKVGVTSSTSPQGRSSAQKSP